MLFLDPEASRRNASGKTVAWAYFRLSGAANLRRVLDDRYVHTRGASRATKPLDRGERRINFHAVVPVGFAGDRTTAEVYTGSIEKRPEFFDALGPQLISMHIVSPSALLWTNLQGLRQSPSALATCGG